MNLGATYSQERLNSAGVQLAEVRKPSFKLGDNQQGRIFGRTQAAPFLGEQESTDGPLQLGGCSTEQQLTMGGRLARIIENKTVTKKGGHSGSRLKYLRNTNVTNWLDGEAEKIHKKLNLNKIQLEQDAILKQARMDQLEKNGIIQPVVSKKKRRKEIDKNNRQLVQALQDSKTISFHGKPLPKSRNTLSQTVLLAHRYGGAGYNRVKSQILKKGPSQSDQPIHLLKSPKSQPTSPSRLVSHPTQTFEIPEETQKQRKNKRKSLQASASRQGASHSKSPITPLRVATLVKNASGVQLTYRGACILPHLAHQKQDRSSSVTKPDGLSRSKTLCSLVKPTSFSKAKMDKARKHIPDANQKMLSRIVNAPIGVTSVKQLQSDYKQHKQRVKTIQRVRKVQQTVVTYSRPDFMNSTLIDSFTQQSRAIPTIKANTSQKAVISSTFYKESSLMKLPSKVMQSDLKVGAKDCSSAPQYELLPQLVETRSRQFMIPQDDSFLEEEEEKLRHLQILSLDSEEQKPSQGKKEGDDSMNTANFLHMTNNRSEIKTPTNAQKVSPQVMTEKAQQCFAIQEVAAAENTPSRKASLKSKPRASKQASPAKVSMKSPESRSQKRVAQSPTKSTYLMRGSPKQQRFEPLSSKKKPNANADLQMVVQPVSKTNEKRRSNVTIDCQYDPSNQHQTPVNQQQTPFFEGAMPSRHLMSALGRKRSGEQSHMTIAHILEQSSTSTPIQLRRNSQSASLVLGDDNTTDNKDFTPNSKMIVDRDAQFFEEMTPIGLQSENDREDLQMNSGQQTSYGVVVDDEEPQDMRRETPLRDNHGRESSPLDKNQVIGSALQTDGFKMQRLQEQELPESKERKMSRTPHPHRSSRVNNQRDSTIKKGYQSPQQSSPSRSSPSRSVKSRRTVSRKSQRSSSENKWNNRNQVVVKENETKKFEQLYGKRLDAILIGTDDINVMGKDFAEVTKDLASLLQKSHKVSEKEKSKVNKQLSSARNSNGFKGIANLRDTISRNRDVANSQPLSMHASQQSLAERIHLNSRTTFSRQSNSQNRKNQLSDQ